MKSSFFLIVVSVVIFSCKEKLTPDTKIEKMPKASFNLTYLGNGKVQINNTSENAVSFNWTLAQLPDYIYKGNTPQFSFFENGSFTIKLSAEGVNDEWYETDTTFVIGDLGDPVPTYFEGTFLDEKGTYQGSNSNSFKYYCCDTGTPWVANILKINSTGNIIVFPYQKMVSGNDKIGFLRTILKPGKLSSDLWSFNITKPDGGYIFTGGFYPVSINSFDILEVEEIDQPKMVPGMENTSFLVTFKVSADYAGVNQKVEGIFKVKYLVY